jgi:thymidylate kinase
MALAEYKTVGRGMRIVEGSYSHHPRFGEYADLTVFCDVEAEEQMRRIRRRNPDLAERFEKEWIPMEEAYIHTYDIRKGLIVG